MEKIEELLLKYQNGLITDAELKELELWVKSDPQNVNHFKKEIQQNFLVDSWALKNSSDKKFEELITPVRSLKRQPFRSLILKYAAIFIIALSVTSLTFLYFNSSGDEPYNPGKIQLTLEDGNTLEIDEDSEKVLLNPNGQPVGIQNYDQLNFTSVKTESEKLSYNTIKVPDGKRLSIVLSDSTIVHLNSNTTLRFPTRFLSTGQREVTITGEAFFAVKHDSSRPFIVYAEHLKVEVLGTLFNVNAYKENEGVSTTLAEGSVKLIMGDLARIIKPGEEGTYLEDRNDFLVKEVKVANNIAWTENRLLFIDEPFSTIMRKIERSYGVRIINNNPELEKVRFNGDFDITTESVEDVLNAFSAVDFFEYSFKGKVITIKK